MTGNVRNITRNGRKTWGRNEPMGIVVPGIVEGVGVSAQMIRQPTLSSFLVMGAFA